MWKNYTIGVLGIAVIIAGFLNLSGIALILTLGILGIAISIIGFMNIDFSKSYSKTMEKISR